MRYAQTPLRPGLTAIAAVLALSSTPLLAQAADVAPSDPATPVIAAPPPVVAAPAPTTAAPAADASSAGLNIPKITVNMDDAPTAAAPAQPKAAAKSTAIKTSSATTHTAKPAATAPAPRTVETPAPVAPAPMAAEVTPSVPAPQVAQAAVEPAPAPAPQPVAQAQPTEDNDVLPIAGAGLAVLALAGGAFALTRRKRREEDYEPWPEEAAAAPAQREELALTEPAPVYAAATPVASTEVRDDAPAANIPAGFDLSRFGRHVQAAYRGPTPDNPSLSLKNRLRRASFYDQRERIAAEAARQQNQPIPDRVAPKPEPEFAAARTHDTVVTRPGNRRNPGFRPAYQG